MYNRKELEENIKKGTNEQYRSAEKVAVDFERFIDDTIVELSEFSREELQRRGINITQDYNSMIIDFKPIDGVKFQIIRFVDSNSISYSISQHGETESMRTIRLLSGIVGMNSIMLYRSRIYPVEAGYADREFSFNGEEKTDGSVINYVDGFLPAPTKHVVYLPETQQYVSIRHWKDYPKAQREQQKRGQYKVVGYVNEDGSVAESKPFIATTYPSFDEGVSDMSLKIEAFKEEWKQVLERLRQGKVQKDQQFSKNKQ